MKLNIDLKTVTINTIFTQTSHININVFALPAALQITILHYVYETLIKRLSHSKYLISIYIYCRQHGVDNLPKRVRGR